MYTLARWRHHIKLYQSQDTSLTVSIHWGTLDLLKYSICYPISNRMLAMNKIWILLTIFLFVRTSVILYYQKVHENMFVKQKKTSFINKLNGNLIIESVVRKWRCESILKQANLISFSWTRKSWRQLFLLSLRWRLRC